ncbi:hypothetical protein BC833DRAFT_595970 [Globomyces pollinis-pini]|nr:hypothetical protein BC833DRAFT_595970 [Globomyces pollinis-pini]
MVSFKLLNIPPSLDNDTLAEALHDFGIVKSCKILFHEHTREYKGEAIVEMDEDGAKSLKEALKTSPLHGHFLKVLFLSLIHSSSGQTI